MLCSHPTYYHLLATITQFRMPLDLKQLEAFVWAVDLGSFSKAADRLNTTQPNISIRIKSLETALKVKLLDRDAGSVRLTSRGQQLIKHARQTLKAADNLVLSMQDNSLRSRERSDDRITNGPRNIDSRARYTIIQGDRQAFQTSRST